MCIRDSVAASDYVKALPDMIAKWLPRPILSLGTEGFGLSEGRDALRDFFEVDARYVTLAALYALAGEGKIPQETVGKALRDLDIDPNKPNPMIS